MCIGVQISSVWKVYYVGFFLCFVFRYHAFKVRPLIGTSFVMSCSPEVNNRFSLVAVLVKAPRLHEVERHLWDCETRGPPSSRSPIQTVRTVAGRDVGRVPKHICTIISKGLREGWLKRAVAVHIGGFVHDGPTKGGGPKLKCVYMLYVKNTSPVSVPFIATFLKPHIDTTKLYC